MIEICQVEGSSEEKQQLGVSDWKWTSRNLGAPLTPRRKKLLNNLNIAQWDCSHLATGFLLKGPDRCRSAVEKMATDVKPLPGCWRHPSPGVCVPLQDHLMAAFVFLPSKHEDGPTIHHMRLQIYSPPSENKELKMGLNTIPRKPTESVNSATPVLREWERKMVTGKKLKATSEQVVWQCQAAILWQPN